jgi:hypothetical protein
MEAIPEITEATTAEPIRGVMRDVQSMKWAFGSGSREFYLLQLIKDRRGIGGLADLFDTHRSDSRIRSRKPGEIPGIPWC